MIRVKKLLAAFVTILAIGLLIGMAMRRDISCWPMRCEGVER